MSEITAVIQCRTAGAPLRRLGAGVIIERTVLLHSAVDGHGQQ